MSRKNKLPAKPQTTDAPKQVEPHRVCPICGPNGGVGNAYHSRDPISYYKCQQCGHTWSVEVRNVETVIRHRETVVRTRDE